MVRGLPYLPWHPIAFDWTKPYNETKSLGVKVERSVGPRPSRNALILMAGRAPRDRDVGAFPACDLGLYDHALDTTTVAIDNPAAEPYLAVALQMVQHERQRQEGAHGN